MIGAQSIRFTKFEQMSTDQSEYSEEEIPELTLQALAVCLSRTHVLICHIVTYLSLDKRAVIKVRLNKVYCRA
jgi:hypothetical protein